MSQAMPVTQNQVPKELVRIFLFSLLTAGLFATHAWWSLHWVGDSMTVGLVRFATTWALFTFLVLPLWVLVLSGLMRLSAWFFEVPLLWLEAFLMAGHSLRYYAIAFAVSLGIAFLFPQWPWIVEASRFIVNVLAFVYSLRVFQQAFVIRKALQPVKAWGMVCFPFLLIALVWGGTVLLTHLALRGA